MTLESGKSKGLGRGLAALIGDAAEGEGALSSSERRVRIDQIDPNPHQPRRLFDDAEIQSLADSVRAHGIIQPLLVRRNPNAPERYQLVAGERRWRAAQRAQLHDVPVLVRQFSEGEALEVALIENVQRTDLNPLEEAEGYRALMGEFGHTQEAVAEAVGKSRSHVANMVRLLDLPQPVKNLIDSGALSMGHGRALLGAKDVEAFAKKVVERGLNVRQTERLAGESRDATSPRRPAPRDPNIVALERELGDKLGLAVSVSHRGESGKLTIVYRSLEQLDDLIHRLGGG